MIDIIKLNTRGGEDNYLKKLPKSDGSESKTYVLKTSNASVRAGSVDNHKYIDPAGGPMIVEGDRLEEADAVVKSIDYIVGFGHTITFF